MRFPLRADPVCRRNVVSRAEHNDQREQPKKESKSFWRIVKRGRAQTDAGEIGQTSNRSFAFYM